MAELRPRAYLAEFVATFALVYVGGGSIVADRFLQEQGQPGFGILGIAFAHGIVLAVMVSATMHISGGHVNPAVTIGQLVTKKIDPPNAFLYIVSQLLGGVVGGALLLASFPESSWGPVNLGTPDLAPGIGIGTGILVEAVLTFFLVFTVFATGVDKRGSGQIAGLAIGFVLIFDILAGGALTGASMNPARTLGTAAPIGFFPVSHVVYWIGPLLGGIIAALIYSYLLLREE
ncbi:MAG: aquaporin [Thermoplasmata archaeon]